MLRNTSSAVKPLREGGSRRALEAELGHTLPGAGNRVGIITADCNFSGKERPGLWLSPAVGGPGVAKTLCQVPACCSSALLGEEGMVEAALVLCAHSPRHGWQSLQPPWAALKELNKYCG